VTNPPYFRRNSAIPSASDDRYIARHETTAGIEEFVDAARCMLKKGGDLYMVHRPDRLADIISALRASDLEPREMQMVTPRAGEPANIVLLHAVKGAGPQLRMLPELPVHNKDGSYTQQILRIYERE
jgi:tRNA1Val (adenine37-N6)-methyltransferase